MRDAIEKMFEQFANRIEFDSLHTHNDKTTIGKICTGFIALILRSYILKKMVMSTIQVEKVIGKVLKTFEKINLVLYKNDETSLACITKKQKDLLKQLEIDEEEFLKI
jgi:hypothetical protein